MTPTGWSLWHLHSVSPLPELLRCLPGTAVHLHTALPVNAHPREGRLETNALFLESLFDIGKRLALM